MCFRCTPGGTCIFVFRLIWFVSEIRHKQGVYKTYQENKIKRNATKLKKSAPKSAPIKNINYLCLTQIPFKDDCTIYFKGRSGLGR